MKVYRAIGTFLSSVLIILLVLVLVSSLLVVSIAQCISKNTISDITKTILSNETVKEEISAGISDALTTMVQSMVSKPTVGGNLQSNDDLQSTQTENNQSEGTLNSIIPGENPENENLETALEKELVIAVSQERISEILSIPAVQDAVADIVAEYAMVIIEQKEDDNVSCFQIVEKMLTDNSQEFNAQIEKIVSDCNMTYDDFYDTAALIASESNLYIPDRGVSYVSVLISIIGQKRGEIDQMIEAVLQDYLPDTERTARPNPTAALRALPVMTATVVMPENTDVLNIASDAIEILQNPKIYAAVFAVILIFFLITALFTWSFKRPLLFIGIASVLTAAVLFVVTLLPMPYQMIADMLAEAIMPDNVSLIGTMYDVAVTTWNAACDIIRVHALSALIIGALCLIGFGFLVYKKTETPEQQMANVNFYM